MRGLTFVELLIAVTMVAILFVGLAAHLRGGITVWRRVTQSTDARRQVTGALDRLSRDVSGAFVLDERPDAYAATAEFPLAAVELKSESLAMYTATSRQREEPAVVQRVAYWCGTMGEHAGLWRSSQSVAQGRVHKGPPPELLLPGCERLSLTYAYLTSADPARQSDPLEWRAAWQDAPKFLPRLIDVTVTLGEASGGRTIQAVMMIPSGVLKPPSQ